MSKNISKSISKKIIDKYSQKLLDHAKQSAADALKNAAKRSIQKVVDATGNLNGKKIVDKITKDLSTWPQNILETVPIETENTAFDGELPRQTKININGISKNNRSVG